MSKPQKKSEIRNSNFDVTVTLRSSDDQGKVESRPLAEKLWNPALGVPRFRRTRLLHVHAIAGYRKGVSCEYLRFEVPATHK